jgi:hypothetical protein
MSLSGSLGLSGMLRLRATHFLFNAYALFCQQQTGLRISVLAAML